MKYRPRIIDYVFLGLAALCFLFTLIFVIVLVIVMAANIRSHRAEKGESLK